MTNKDLRKVVVLFSVAFIFFCLAGERVVAKVTDSADVEVLYTSAYPGHFAKMTVRLMTPVAIAGYSFMITLSNADLFNFHTDSIRVELDSIPLDTCTWQPDSLHHYHPECYRESLFTIPVRYCYIDTVGSLTANRMWSIKCHGEVGDTSSRSCKYVLVMGMAKWDNQNPQQLHPIPPTSSYQTLFKLGLDVFCLSDSVQDRRANFYMFASANSWLADPQGNVVPFRYHLPEAGGQFMTSYGRPGDANGDSLLNLGDIVFLIGYVFRGGPAPCIPETADTNGDCHINLGDIVYLIGYIFRGGPAPKVGCWHGK